MTKEKKTPIEKKIQDYTQFAQILIAVSAFLFIGILIQSSEKTIEQLMMMNGGIILSSLLSFFFLSRVKKLTEKTNENT